MSEPEAEPPGARTAAPRAEALPDKLTATSRTSSLAARRGLSNGFSRPAAPPPPPPKPPSRVRLASRSLGIAPRPLAVGLVVGAVLFVALRAFGSGA